MQVSELFQGRHSELFTIGPDGTVAELIESLNLKHIGALVVTDPEGRWLGLVSERAVLRIAYDSAKRTVDCSKTVRELMRKKGDLPAITMRTRLNEALGLMHSARTRHLVVVSDDERPIACVSVRDIAERLLESAQMENRELQKFMYGFE
jgi:CBS domain-containing protein